ncbi:MAG: glycosyltransferase [Planctomycetia bacterium]|nr:glycosyltransferase [Planctomycetia bacterium]
MNVSTPAPPPPLPAYDRPASRRLRVLHLVFSLDSGGLENGVVNLCNRLDPQRFAPAICTFSAGGALESRVDRNRVELCGVERRWNNDPTLPLRLARQLRRRHVELLHTHSWGTLIEGMVAARLARVPRIVHGEHGVLDSHRRHVLLQRWFWSRADQLLAVSSPLADCMANLVGLPRERIEVVANGVDTDRFQPAGNRRAEERAAFGLPSGGLLLGMVARLVPVKNHAGVLEVVARLRSQGLEVALALAGDGPLRDELAQLARELKIADRVHFLGDVARVERFYQAIDVFILNSHSEGMSNTILEAMACGLPIVATSVGSNAEIIVARRTGMLVAKDNVVELAAALNELVGAAALREALGTAARQRAKEEYSVDRMVGRYEQIYEQLAAPLVRRRQIHD